MADMEVDSAIDEGLYSRQLYVMGHEAQRRMGAASVLVVGLNGVGVEIAKNVILAGVRTVAVCDDAPASVADLGSQFYLDEASVGQPRAQASLAQLQSLNPYVEVSAVAGAPTAESLAGFSVVVAVSQPQPEQLRLNELCAAAGAKFIAADAWGVFASVFCDFGDDFVVHDTDGEAPMSCTVSEITQDEAGVVTVLDDERHGLETGDVVTFSCVEGMTELNDLPPQPVTVTGPFTFTICDTRSFGACVRGGYVAQIKQPKTVHFRRLAAALEEPGELPMYDGAKFDTAPILHRLFRGLHAFQAAHDGDLPAGAGDGAELLSLAPGAGNPDDGEREAKLAAQLAHGARAVLSPMAAFIGGIAGQEVLKACSGKFSPIQQFLHFDCVECLPEPLPAAEECAPTGSRYDAQVAVFGRQVQAKVEALRYFMVGSGAIACEMLKNWALMGVAAGEGGRLVVTDDDRIERSNLNRQFLFRSGDVGQLKSATAAAAARRMNGAMNVEALDLRVGADTEAHFNDAFFDELDGVCNALDNLDARLFMDQKCLFYGLPLLESGTKGTKGNTQVVVPHMTENYGATRDPPEKTIPLCTLKNFPSKIEHTIQWARDWFQGEFNQRAAAVNSYLSTPDFLSTMQSESLASQMETLEAIKASLVDDKPLAFEECVAWARLQFQELFNNSMRQLLHNFPEDQVTSSGVPFWSGAKKPPTPVEFDAADPVHLGFVMAAANLRAANYGLSGNQDPAFFEAVLQTVEVPAFTPRSGVKIAANDEEAKAEAERRAQAAEITRDSVQAVFDALPPVASLAGYRMAPVDFDKDDDSHMNVVAACSNLRARVYKIPEADMHRTRQIAGKIIPAIATTTAAVTGLVCFELYKLLVGGKPIEAMRNSFFNLAVPFFTAVEPAPAKVNVSALRGGADEWRWGIWDRIDVVDDPNMTVQGLMDLFEERYGLEVSMISCGVAMLYYCFGKTARTRLPMRLVDVAEQVTKKAPAPGQRYMIFEVCVADIDSGDDVDVPYVRFRVS